MSRFQTDTLRQEASRLRHLAERCQKLAAGTALPAGDRDELHRAAEQCRALAAELDDAAADLAAD